MDYFQKCLEKFCEMPEYIRMAVGSDVAVQFINGLEKKYNVDLKFPIILITINELKIDQVPEYLNKKHKLTFENGEIIKQQLKEKLFAWTNDEVLPEEHYEKKDAFDLEKNEQEILTMFTNSLAINLQSNISSVRNNSLNDKILLALSSENIQKELENALYENQEKITHKKFVFNGKTHAPSIGNWLKDFIKRQGTGIFDNVTLTNYVTNSENGKILDAEERKTVTKLLMLYRNLKFFPDSMPNDTGENWEIIPVELTGRGREKIGNISGPPKTVEEKEIDRLKVEEEKYMTGGLEQQAIEEEVEKKKKVEDLKAIASKYKPDSLEYKAVMEEIEKITK